MVLDVVDLPERGDVGEVAVHKGLALLGGLLDAEGRGLAIAQQLRPVHVGTGSGVPPLRCTAAGRDPQPWLLVVPLATGSPCPLATGSPCLPCCPLPAPRARRPPVPSHLGRVAVVPASCCLGFDSAKKLHDKKAGRS